MGKARGMRFTDVEDLEVEEFLEKNPVLDFTTLARLAIMGFVRNPTTTFQPVERKPTKKVSKNVRSN
jgi:hypothetical protein